MTLSLPLSLPLSLTLTLTLLPGGTGAQAAQALANCAAVLAGLGFEARHTLQMVVYLTADADAAAVRYPSP